MNDLQRKQLGDRLFQWQIAFGELHDAWAWEKSKRWISRRYLVHPYLQKRLSRGFFQLSFQ